MQPALHGRVALIGMDELDPPSTGQTLRRVAEILDGSPIQIVQIALWSTAPYQRRNRVDDELELLFAGTQRVLRPPALVDVRQQHAPSNDLPVAIAKRKAAILKPAIVAIGAAKALLDLVRAAGCDRTREDIENAGYIVGMDRAAGRPPSELVLGLAEVVKHLPIENVDFSSRREDRNHAGDGVHNHSGVAYPFCRVRCHCVRSPRACARSSLPHAVRP